MNLMRSIPRDYKGGVRSLEEEGFKGFNIRELTPNKTRRAQAIFAPQGYHTKILP